MKNFGSLRSVAAASVVALGLAAAPQANAITVDSVGENFTVLFYNAALGLDATVKFTLTNFDINNSIADDVDFDIDITNNSLLSTSRFTAFGIVNLTPNVSGANADEGWDATIGSGTQLAGTSVELCLWDGSNCNGGGNVGVVGAGGFETFDLDLNLSSLTSAGITLSGFTSKFQTAGISYHLTGCIYNVDQNCTRNPPPTNVPEPTTLALFSLGLLGVGFAARRRKAK